MANTPNTVPTQGTDGAVSEAPAVQVPSDVQNAMNSLVRAHKPSVINAALSNAFQSYIAEQEKNDPLAEYKSAYKAVRPKQSRVGRPKGS